MATLEIQIEGIGFWAPGWPDWDSLCDGLRLGRAPAEDMPGKPIPTMLPQAERRRAPDPVLIACEVAAQACAAAGRDGDTLATVFASTHGDLVITDYMCSTLATAPRELSPVRFHNSVHNAPAGYWTIAAHCHSASTSISGWHTSFAVALFEAAVQALADDAPVLLAAYDNESRGPLVAVSPSAPSFGVAMVISPVQAELELPRLRLGFVPASVHVPASMPPALQALAEGNPMASSAMPLLVALVSDSARVLDLPAGIESAVRVEIL